MLRATYNLLLHTAAAVAGGPVYLWATYRRPRFREALLHRLGRTAGLPAPPSAPPLWLHGVSLGEVRALQPLVRAWTGAHPDRPLVVSSSTETGLDAARALYPDATVTPFPLDTPPAVAAHLDRWRPACVALLETELWPNFFWGCARRHIPLCIISGRISTRTLQRAGWLGPLWRSVLACGSSYAMQSDADADRMRRLGAPADRIHVLGNLKWDGAHAPASDSGAQWRHTWGVAPDVPLLLWGSTHAPEERLALQAWRTLRDTWPALRLVVAPRHPERFDAVAAELAGPGVRLRRRSDGADPAWDVLLLDTLGELVETYPAATIAVMGGTFAPIGGHNILEPLAAGVPLLLGPHTTHIRALREAAEAARAVHATTEEHLAADAGRLLDDAATRATLAANGRALIAAHQGCAARLLAHLEALWPDTPSCEA